MAAMSALLVVFVLSVIVDHSNLATGELQVVGASFPRTGTTSLHEALDRLGFKTYHLQNMPDAHIPLWKEVADVAAAGEPTHVLFRDIFQNHTAVVGFPAAVWWDEILAAFPKARLILTRRDADDWYESARSTLFAFRRSWQRRCLIHFDATIEARWTTLHAAFRRACHDEDELDPADPGHKDEVVGGYRHHVGRIRGAELEAPSYLEWNMIDMSWSQLCTFLEIASDKCPVNEAFPHTNTRWAYYRKMFLPTTLLFTAFCFVPVFLVLCCLVICHVTPDYDLESKLRKSKVW